MIAIVYLINDNCESDSQFGEVLEDQTDDAVQSVSGLTDINTGVIPHLQSSGSDILSETNDSIFVANNSLVY